MHSLAADAGRLLWLIPLLLALLGCDSALLLLRRRSRRSTGCLLLLFVAGVLAAAVTINLTPGGVRLFSARHVLAHGGAAVAIAAPLLVYDVLAAGLMWRLIPKGSLEAWDTVSRHTTHSH